MHRYSYLVGRSVVYATIAVLGMIDCTIEDDSTVGDLDEDRGASVDYPLCRRGNFDVNPRRSLFETHVKALSYFTLDNALGAIAGNSGLLVDPVTTHDFLFDTYNQGPGLPGSPQHCDDDVAFSGGPGLNGFPLECPRAEGGRIGEIKGWIPLAAVNRFDLAPKNGENCGEARLVFAHESPRVFVILEAKVPNPNPECGIEACAPVQHFWAKLTDIDDPGERGKQLYLAYIKGHPFLTANGFPPFLNVDAFRVGAGQLRTNNFNDRPWTLREYKAFDDYPAGELRFIEVPVAANPYGEYFNDTAALPLGDECRKALIGSVVDVLTNNVNRMAVDVPEECLAAESPDDAVQEYVFQLGLGGGALEAALQAEAAAHGSALTGAEIARRMHFAGACIGCHQQATGFSLGNGVVAPNSLGFVHTSEELPFEDCGDGDIGCWVISDALKYDFLPFREKVMESFLAGGPCCKDRYDEEMPLSFGVPRIDTTHLDAEEILALEAELDAQRYPVTIGGAPTSRAH